MTRRSGAAVAFVLVALVAAVLTVALWPDGRPPASRRSLPIVAPSPSAPVESVPDIAPSAPITIAFTYRDAGGQPVTVRAPVGTVDAFRHADGTYDAIVPAEDTAAALQTAAWWRQPPSYAPSVPAQPGSTYIYGHACATASCVFNDVHLLRVGDSVTVTTSAGVFTYRVGQDATAVQKSGPNDLTHSSVYDLEPNLLWLVTCGYQRNPHDGRYESPFNWVVGAALVDARPTR